jgi:hypothetical protein
MAKLSWPPGTMGWNGQVTLLKPIAGIFSGSFLTRKRMRAATALDLPSVSDFQAFHTLAE